MLGSLLLEALDLIPNAVSSFTFFGCLLHIKFVEDPFPHVRLRVYLSILSVAHRQMKPLDQTRHQLICRQHEMAVLVECLKLPIFLAERLI